MIKPRLQKVLTRIFIIFFLLPLCGTLLAQPLVPGVPFIQSFSKAVYQAGSQNRDIVQDQRGVIYLANNNGMLSYDGTFWKLYPLPNLTILRSLAIDEQGFIYAGGQNEFGRFEPNAQGEWVFHSLCARIPEEHRNFEDVWEIKVLGKEVYWRSAGKLFRLLQDEVYVYPARNLVFMDTVEGQIMVQQQDSGLWYARGDSLYPLKGTASLAEQLVMSVLGLEGRLLIFTNDGHTLLYDPQQQQLQAWPNRATSFLKQNRIEKAIPGPSQHLIAGTTFGGILSLDTRGEVHLLVDQSNELLSNKISGLFVDKSRNLWAGLENGINHIQLNTPFTKVFPDHELKGTGQAACAYGDYLYLATNNGLYRRKLSQAFDPLSKQHFELVANSRGQTWGLDTVGGELLLGHNYGAFVVKGKEAIRFYADQGVWSFDALPTHPGTMVAGTYFGLSFFQKRNGQWQHLGELPGFEESSRFVEIDRQGDIWIAHPYRGVFRVIPAEDLLRSEVIPYGEQDGLPSDLHNHLFKIGGEIVFCGARGIFYFDKQQQRFLPNARFNSMFGPDTKVRRLQETPGGHIWYITEDEVGLLNIRDRALEKEVEKINFSAIKHQLNAGFEQIYPYRDEQVFFTAEQGFIQYTASEFDPAAGPFQLVFNEIRLTQPTDSLVFAGVFTQQGKPSVFQLVEDRRQFPHAMNALRFSYSATNYTEAAYLQYRYRLRGFDKDWSAWSRQKTKEYTNLPAGTYDFEVQCRTPLGRQSDTLRFYFEILPPWYASPLAYLLYALGMGVAIFTLVWFSMRKYRNLKEDHIQSVARSNKEIGKLKQENVQAELRHKQREIISTTMHLVQKNETIHQIRDRLKAIKKMARDEKVTQELHRLIQLLKHDEFLDDGWEQFMFHFNQLHGGFFNRLKADYPHLTPKDLKLCAYLYMNLSTKEIASLMNVTVRGVEASRYRLRKKLGLDKDDNLTEFLMQY